MQSWHALSVAEVKRVLAEQPKNYGTNELKDFETVPWYSMLTRQFVNLLIFVLLFAMAISFFLGDLWDALAILAIVIFNGLLGFFQEWRAETTIQKLKSLLSPSCYIIRNGEKELIDVKKLLPGDCVLLQEGNIVPADIRVTHAVDLLVNEAELTGESAPVAKLTEALAEKTILTDRRNIAFMGTHIVSGHGEGLVVEIGMNTEFGRIAQLTGTIKETKTKLQHQLETLGKQFGLIALLISSLVIIAGVLGGKNIITMLMTGISLAVSAIPEGLPAVVTIALALGAKRMAHKKVLLRRLQAAETLGAVSVICTDKTGTLTRNEMTVQKIWTADGVFSVTGTGYEPHGNFQREGLVIEPESYPELIALLTTCQKCNHACIKKIDQQWQAIGSPDEAALIAATIKAGLELSHHPVIREFAFDSNRKRMSTVEETEAYLIVHVKGAPEAILNRSTHFLMGKEEKELTKEYRDHIENAYIAFAKQGLRTLAIARKIIPKEPEITVQDAETNLTFLGVIGLFDPPRSEAPLALTQAEQAGIRVIMITGDSPITAHALATQLGLDIEKIVTSEEISELTDLALCQLLEQKILFARTVPQDKFRIVKLLQSRGNLTAMTGDGVNDAPSLKQADIGIAMGTRGTDVARSAADMVLSDDNFASIIAAIEEGRRQYANIRKFILYLAASNTGELLAILINIVIGGPLILMPIQILWINLVTDSATAISLSLEQAEKNSMKQPPRQINQPIFDKKALLLLGLFGSYLSLTASFLYHFYLNESYEIANTMAFTAIVVMANVLTLNFRSFQKPMSEIGWFSNKLLLTAIIAMIALQIAAVYLPVLQPIFHTVPLSLLNWGVIVLCALPLFIIPEAYKRIREL